MKITIIGDVEINTAVFEDFIAYMGISDVDGEICFCDLPTKRQIHSKYMKMPYKHDRQYRAYSYPSEKKIFIFLNEGETMDSLVWLLAHELTHHNLHLNSFLKRCCNATMYRLLENRNITWDEFMANYDSYIEDDDFHDYIVEEQICNTFATSIMGYDFGRKWWKEQLRTIDNKKIA